jgi:hypothetical protein
LHRKLFVLVLTAAAGAGAVDVTDWLSVNGTNEAVYMRQREDGHRWTWDVLRTEVWAWRFAAGVEAEFDHPRRPVFETTELDIEGDEIVQRYARYRDDIFDLRAGDFDKTLGKGLTLRSYEERDFGVYQRLDGGVADACVAIGEREWGDVTALWGRSSRQIEATTAEGKEEIGRDKVGGGQLTIRPVDFFYLTGSAVKAEVINPFAQGYPTEESELYAGGLGGGWQYFDLYGEYAVRDGSEYEAGIKEEIAGTGFYGIVTGYLPRSSVSFQYKLYDDLAYRYNNPPPVSVDEHMITGPDSLTPGEWGYYAQASANPLTDVRVSGGYSYADDKVGENDVKGEEVEQYFGNVRYDLPWPVVVEGEYEYLGNIHIAHTGVSEDVTGDIKRTPSLAVSWTPWDRHSFSTKFEREEKTDYTEAGRIFIYNRADVGYTFSSWLGLTVSYEDTDQKARELVRRGLDPVKDPDVYRFKNNWLWGEVRLSGYSEVFQNHVLTIGYGSRRGGLVCSSGVCRTETPFTGLKVSLESSF